MLIEIVAKADHQTKAACALAEGLSRHGVPVAVVDGVSKATSDVVACWGWRNGKVLSGQGKRVLVMERAYIGDRFHWISLSWDGLNGHARFPSVDDGGKRWRLAFDGALRPRRDPAGGGEVIVFGQVPTDMSLKGWPGAMTWPVAARGLDDRPRLGEREGVWADRMAFAQWEPGEIAAGIAWEALKDCMQPGTGHRFGDWRVDAESAYWPAKGP